MACASRRFQPYDYCDVVLTNGPKCVESTDLAADLSTFGRLSIWSTHPFAGPFRIEGREAELMGNPFLLKSALYRAYREARL